MAGDIAMRTILTSQEADQFPVSTTGAWSTLRGEVRAEGVVTAGEDFPPTPADVIVYPNREALADVGVDVT
jgi:hypothetical protein